MKMHAALLSIAFALPFCTELASAGNVETPMLATCRHDSDCKLIYSSCTCETAGIADPRNHLDDYHGMECHHNVCRSEKAKAVCDAGICRSTLRLPQANGTPAGR